MTGRFTSVTDLRRMFALVIHISPTSPSELCIEHTTRGWSFCRERRVGQKLSRQTPRQGSCCCGGRDARRDLGIEIIDHGVALFVDVQYIHFSVKYSPNFSVHFSLFFKVTLFDAFNVRIPPHSNNPTSGSPERGLAEVRAGLVELGLTSDPLHLQVRGVQIQLRQNIITGLDS